MKRAYESFQEIADDFTDGAHWTHALSEHRTEDCFAWQHGVMEFAEFLDAVGVKMIANPEIYEQLWEDIRTHKPEKFKDHKGE